jgi:hypothetical protein
VARLRFRPAVCWLKQSFINEASVTSRVFIDEKQPSDIRSWPLPDTFFPSHFFTATSVTTLVFIGAGSIRLSATRNLFVVDKVDATNAVCRLKIRTCDSPCAGANSIRINYSDFQRAIRQARLTGAAERAAAEKSSEQCGATHATSNFLQLAKFPYRGRNMTHVSDAVILAHNLFHSYSATPQTRRCECDSQL